VLIGAGRSNTTAFVSSTAKAIPTGFQISGAAELKVTIDKNAHVETGTGKPGKHEPAPPPKVDEPKPKPAVKPETPASVEKDI